MLDNLKNWALGQSKRLAAAAALVVTLAASQPAYALYAACVSTSTQCSYSYHCELFYDDDTSTGIEWGGSFYLC